MMIIVPEVILKGIAPWICTTFDVICVLGAIATSNGASTSAKGGSQIAKPMITMSKPNSIIFIDFMVIRLPFSNL